MGTPRTPAERVRDAFMAAAPRIESRRDLDRAWAEASEMLAVVDELRGEVASIRARTAARIAERDSLSLAGLAERLTISRARAGQLLTSSRESDHA